MLVKFIKENKHQNFSEGLFTSLYPSPFPINLPLTCSGLAKAFGFMYYCLGCTDSSLRILTEKPEFERLGSVRKPTLEDFKIRFIDP